MFLNKYSFQETTNFSQSETMIGGGATNTKQSGILYSFRRCPFAMRARHALLSAKISVIIREVSLKNKPLELKTISERATVPCLQTPNRIIPESLDIMYWALSKNDPEYLLNVSKAGMDIITYNDGPFKNCLDRTKYRSSYIDVDIDFERKIARDFLGELNRRLKTEFVLGQNKTLVDLAILPFIRQYAFIDKSWFDNQNWSNLNRWLNTFLNSETFAIMQRKYEFWKAGDKPIIF